MWKRIEDLLQMIKFLAGERRIWAIFSILLAVVMLSLLASGFRARTVVVCCAALTCCDMLLLLLIL